MDTNIKTNCSEVFPIVMGVNEQTLCNGHPNAQVAPENVTCSALLLKVLDDNFGIIRAFFTTTNSGAHSPILTDADTARMIGQVLPDLRGLVDGNTLAVASQSTDFVTITAELRTIVTPPELRNAFLRYADGPFKGLLAFHSEPVAASQVIGQLKSAIFDASAARVINNNLVQIAAFYDAAACHPARILEFKKIYHTNNE